jgi:hypothetical protein
MLDGDFTDGTTAFDLRSEGPSTTSLAEAIAAAVPRPEEVGDVFRDTSIGEQVQQELLALGIDVRDLSLDELISYLAGRALYQDLPAGLAIDPTGFEVAVDRLSPRPVLQLLATYRAMFYTQTIDPETGEVEQASRTEQIGNVLQEALNTYMGQAGQFDPYAFRNFVETTPEMAEALSYLNGLRTIFQQLDLLALSPAETAAARSKILSDVKPEGITLPQFELVVIGRPMPEEVTTEQVVPEDMEDEGVSLAEPAAGDAG